MRRGSLHTRSFRPIHLRFYIQMNEKWLYGPEKLPGLSRNGPLSSMYLLEV